MKCIKYLAICLFSLVSCEKDSDENILQTLALYVEGENVELGAVIACATSNQTTNDIITFYYPETGASNIRLYQTDTLGVDESDFSNYNQAVFNSDLVFNGHLEKFVQSSDIERWVIVTFELNNEIKISNPIRTKQITKPTVWNDDVTIDQSQSRMPSFSWTDNPLGDNAIYFQVISDAQNNLLSGTYTYENKFQYYNTSNVVLNVTTQTPPALIIANEYNFTLMDVSEDNWVNWVVSKAFESE